MRVLRDPGAGAKKQATEPKAPAERKTVTVESIRVKFDADESPVLSVTDLKKSADGALKQLATLGGRDRWLSRAEMEGATGLYANTHYRYENLARGAQAVAFEGTSIARLREEAAAGRAPALDTRPAPVNAAAAAAGELPRSAFVPLAEFLATQFAVADSYASELGDGTNRIYHFAADDLLTRYSLPELKAACAILTARNGFEFALTRDEHGGQHLVQGIPNQVEMHSEVIGVDQVFHTHPTLYGATQRGPSTGDLQSARDSDPDAAGCVVTEDGWNIEYAARSQANEVAAPQRLWRSAT